MSTPLSTPFNDYARRVTAKLRSRMHTQAFSAIVMDAQRRRLTPSGKVAVQRVDELKALIDSHKRTFDPHATARARAIFQNLPLLSADEDPHFATSIRALRYAAYFQLAQSPSTFALLNHLVQHAHFLDGFNVYSLCGALVELQCAQTRDALDILRPRVLELLTGSRRGENVDLTATEAAFLLRTLGQFGTLDDAVVHAAAAIMMRTGSDLPVPELCEVLDTWRRLVRHSRTLEASAESQSLTQAIQHGAKGFLASTQQAIREHLREGRAVLLAARRHRAVISSVDAEGPAASRNRLIEADELREALRQHRQLVRHVPRLIEATEWAPRRMLADVARAVATWSEANPSPSPATSLSISSLTRGELALFCRMLQRTSYRDERSLRLAASRVATSDIDTRANTEDAGYVSVSPSLHVERPMNTARREELRALSDYADAVESLAFFGSVQSVDTVAALLMRAADVIGTVTPTGTSSSRQAPSSPSSSLAVVTQSARLLEGVAHVQYLSRVRPQSQEACLSTVISPAQTLVACPAAHHLLAIKDSTSSGTAYSVPLARYAKAVAVFTAMLMHDETQAAAGAAAPLATVELVQTCKRQLNTVLAAVAHPMHAGTASRSPAERAEVLACVSAAASALRPVLPRLTTPSDAGQRHDAATDAQLSALVESL